MSAAWHPSSATKIIAACTSLRKLALWDDKPSSVEALLRAAASSESNSAHRDLTHIAFDYDFQLIRAMPRSVTHLCLYFQSQSLDDAAAQWTSVFASHPTLTHIMFFHWCVSVWDLDEWLFPTRASRMPGLCSVASTIFGVTPKTLKAIICHPALFEWTGHGSGAEIRNLEDRMADMVQRMHREIADSRFVLVCPDPTYINLAGIACYDEFHDWEMEWDGFLPEGGLDVWEMADRYLAVQADRNV